MKISIWDLDYYFAEDKTNLINPDAQKISSYHKQCGDQVNFVQTPYDINRPYDIYYIIKENAATPNPPIEFLVNPKVRWCGAAYSMKRNWKMPDAMLACRPDYLLYPNRETRLERAEHIRLIGNSNNLLPITQDWSNTFKDKYIIVDDKQLWYCSEEVIIQALSRITHIKNVSFAEPVWIEKIRTNPKIQEAFFKLQLSTRSSVSWNRIKLEEAAATMEWLKLFAEHFPKCPMKPLPVLYAKKPWHSADEARHGWKLLKDLIKDAKHQQIDLRIIAPRHREDTPFFFLPELVCNWCELNFKLSWLEYLSIRFKVDKNYMSGSTEWNKPDKWHPLFRDVIRQTYEDKEFLLLKWGHEKISELEIPWNLWKETFKLGL